MVILGDVSTENVSSASPLHVRGELDTAALRAQGPAGLLDGIDRAVVWDIPMTARFRGITRRDGVLLHGPAGWGEVAPFWNHGPDAAAPWLASALESALLGTADLPRHRDTIPVNVTVPEVDPEAAHALVTRSGATTAKVKVAGVRDGAPANSAGTETSTDSGNTLAADTARLEAVRDALGPTGHIRIDVNGAWDLATAIATLPLLDRAAGGLEYAEQPCAHVDDLAALRRRVEVPIAADESVRLAADPLAVARLEAADVVVLKVAPLGGVRRALALADRLGLPAVVSSALDTSVGIGAGLALAAALPDPPRACGLGTLALLARDVARTPAPAGGQLPVRPVRVSVEDLDDVGADAELAARWQARLGTLLHTLAARREREGRDPDTVIGGLPL